jgi:hypothetical protein
MSVTKFSLSAAISIPHHVSFAALYVRIVADTFISQRRASTHNEGTELPRTSCPHTYTPRDRLRIELAFRRHTLWSYNKIKNWYSLT